MPVIQLRKRFRELPDFSALFLNSHVDVTAPASFSLTGEPLPSKNISWRASL